MKYKRTCTGEIIEPVKHQKRNEPFDSGKIQLYSSMTSKEEREKKMDDMINKKENEEERALNYRNNIAISLSFIIAGIVLLVCYLLM